MLENTQIKIQRTFFVILLFEQVNKYGFDKLINVSKNIIIIGAGAAGYFGAISAAESNPDAKIIL